MTRHWRLPVDLRENAELITSELATNALKATRAFHEAMGIAEVGCIKLRLRRTDPSLVIEVWDINPVLPVKREADAYDTGGRGLGIIEFLCHRWDAVRCRGGGKLVWAEQRIS